MTSYPSLRRLHPLLVLGLLWLLSALNDVVWLALDRSVPSWDLAKHLIGSLNHWWALQHPQFFSQEWWQGFLTLSSKYPILTYVSTAPFLNLFGTGPEQATLVNLFYNAVLLGAVYGMGKHLFSSRVGLWAAGFCLLLPRLYVARTEYLLDYPLLAMVVASFWCLTVWRDAKTQKRQWGWALGFGLCFGLAMMAKQSAVFFLFVPLLWLGGVALWQRTWRRVAQLVSGLLLALVVLFPWYRTNWLFVLSASNNSNVAGAIAEGDPPLNTLGAWIYYWNDLPAAVSWPLLLVPIVGLLLYGSGWFPAFKSQPDDLDPENRSGTGAALRWLAILFGGSYFLWSAVANKDLRYIMPYLPVVALFLGYGMTRWPRRWWGVRWGTVGVAVLLMWINIFPIGGNLGRSLAQVLTPQAQHPAYLGAEWPHLQVIEEIIQTEPYLRTNLGVLPATAEIDQHNFNYYGALRNFQVYGRQFGSRDTYREKDLRSLSWFLTKTGNQGIFWTDAAREKQAKMAQAVEQSPEFQVRRSWQLPDGNTLNLYHRQVVPVDVRPLLGSPSLTPTVQLEQVVVPQQVPPGQPVPISYQWSGPWQQLRDGIVLLTWRHQSPPAATPQNQYRWLHDHGIGLGNLQSNRSETELASAFQVIERTAMLPPAELIPGTYILEASYLNRRTQETYAIAVPPVTIQINPTAAAVPAPELDLVTQLRQFASVLPQGPSALEEVFDRIGQINLYDPIQDYTVQADRALTYRLQQEPNNLEFAYGLSLSRVLQKRVKSAIAALQQVVELDSQNPYAYGYLAFVNLYDFRAQAAQSALQSALALNPNLPEIQALSGVAALMQGNLLQAWHYAQAVLASLQPSQ